MKSKMKSCPGLTCPTQFVSEIVVECGYDKIPKLYILGANYLSKPLLLHASKVDNIVNSKKKF